MNEFDKIKMAREELGLSQSDLAGLMGDVPNAVSKLEAGQKKFIPNKYVKFLVGKNYDINTLFDDEKELKKVSDDSNSISEPKENYYKATDKELLKRIIQHFGLHNKMQLVEYLTQLDEKRDTVSLLEITTLKVWENKYLEKFEYMERRLQLIAESIIEEAAAKLNPLNSSESDSSTG